MSQTYSFCPQCGTAAREGQAFCSQCGTSLTQPADTDTTQQAVGTASAGATTPPPLHQSWETPAGYAPSPAHGAAPVARSGAQMNPLRWVNVGALVVAGIGLFMAWATIGPFSVSGVDTDDGKLFGVILIVTGLFLLWWILQNSNKGAGILLMIGWAALVAMSIYEITNVSSKHYSVLGVSLSVGAGLYLNTIGSVAGIVTAAIDVSKSWDERSNQPVAGVLFVTGLVVVLGSIGAGVAGARNTSSTVSNPSNVSGSNGNSGALTNSGSTGNTGSLNSGSTGNNGSFNRGSTGNSGGFNSGSTGNSG